MYQHPYFQRYPNTQTWQMGFLARRRAASRKCNDISFAPAPVTSVRSKESTRLEVVQTGLLVAASTRAITADDGWADQSHRGFTGDWRDSLKLGYVP